MRTEEVAAWINEREAIRLRKEIILDGGFDTSTLGQARLAWGEGSRILKENKGIWTLDYLTDDPILSKFRFCNVRREDDRVTIWIRQNIIEPYADHEHLWFMLAIARTINWPPTLKELIEGRCDDEGEEGSFRGDPLPSWPGHPHYLPQYTTQVMDNRKRRGDKVYTGAYMIRAESDTAKPWYHWSKQRYIGEIVLGKLWEDRASWHMALEGFKGDPRFDSLGKGQMTSEAAWYSIQGYTGWGPFMGYQWVVDLQHTRYLRDAPDKQTWAAAGPGTIRGINRCLGNGPTAPMTQRLVLPHLLALREELHQPGVLAPYVPVPIDLSDICNVCCEYDKYERVRLGEGRPRAMYVPGRGY